MASARAALEKFWGDSNGGAYAWGVCFSAIKSLNLKTKDLERLRLRLPNTTGTTSLRVEILNQMLQELALG